MTLVYSGCLEVINRVDDSCMDISWEQIRHQRTGSVKKVVFISVFLKQQV